MWTVPSELSEQVPAHTCLKTAARASRIRFTSPKKQDARDGYVEPHSFRLTGDPIPILPNKMIRLGLQPASMFLQ